jgi:hypothetical protein
MTARVGRTIARMLAASRALRRKLNWELTIGAVIAFVNFVAFFIYGYQLSEMRKATQAASDGLGLTRQMSQVTRQMAEIDQRAWVAEKEVSSAGPVAGQPLKIKVIVENTGKSFAKNVKGGSAWRSKHLSSPDPDFDQQLVAVLSNRAPILIPPNGSFVHIVSAMEGTDLTKADLETLHSPVHVFLIFGKITYEDIFGCEHWTTLCYRMYGDGTFEKYGSYNDADNNCGPHYALK